MNFASEDQLNCTIATLELYHAYLEWRREKQNKGEVIEPQPSLAEMMAFAETAVQNAHIDDHESKA
jgi:hypothetical protein